MIMQCWNWHIKSIIDGKRLISIKLIFETILNQKATYKSGFLLMILNSMERII